MIIKSSFSPAGKHQADYHEVISSFDMLVNVVVGIEQPFFSSTGDKAPADDHQSSLLPTFECQTEYCMFQGSFVVVVNAMFLSSMAKRQAEDC